MKATGREPDPAFGRLVAHGLAREVDASGNACPDADLLAGWFDHTLSSLEAERVESHAAGCECCQQILAALARSEPEVIRAAPLPAPSRAWHWHWRWAVPLATAVLVVVVGTRTLRAPGPTPIPVAIKAQLEAQRRRAAAPEAAPQVQAPTVPASPSGSGGASSLATPVANSPQPTQVTADKVVPAPPLASPRLRPLGDVEARRAATQMTEVQQLVRVAAGMPPAPPPPPPPAGAAPAAVAAPQAAKPEEQVAATAQRQSDAASAKMTKTAAPTAAVPPLAESVLVQGRASTQAEALPSVRQVSVVAPAAPGSAISWRFGHDGGIEKSSDHGQTWERQPSGVTTALSDASAPSDRVCWIVGAGGVVLRTIDGKTWQRLSPPTDADLVAVHAWNELSATVIASNRSGYETADGGRTWKRQR